AHNVAVQMPENTCCKRSHEKQPKYKYRQKHLLQPESGSRPKRKRFQLSKPFDPNMNPMGYSITTTTT
nr:hypothetical protein [Tanacetum cinerariifolium]